MSKQSVKKLAREKKKTSEKSKQDEIEKQFFLDEKKTKNYHQEVN